MARRTEVTKGFQKCLNVRRLKLTSPGYEDMCLLITAMGNLAEHELPGPGDIEYSVPPGLALWVRKVEGYPLWLYYDFTSERITFRLVANKPPEV